MANFRIKLMHPSQMWHSKIYAQARSQTTSIGATKNFRGTIVTVRCHHTQLTITITDSATAMK